jgi:hypothetical protein
MQLSHWMCSPPCFQPGRGAQQLHCAKKHALDFESRTTEQTRPRKKRPRLRQLTVRTRRRTTRTRAHRSGAHSGRSWTSVHTATSSSRRAGPGPRQTDRQRQTRPHNSRVTVWSVTESDNSAHACGHHCASLARWCGAKRAAACLLHERSEGVHARAFVCLSVCRFQHAGSLPNPRASSPLETFVPEHSERPSDQPSE